MRPLALALLLAACAGLGYAGLRAVAPRAPEVPPPVGAREATTPPTDRAALDAAIRRGVAYLVGAQNPSGSWGGCASNLWDIYAPVPGSYYAFEVAVTALAVDGLRVAAPDDPAAAAAARRGLDWLVASHTKARRVSPDVLYNVWAHAYALEAFAGALGAETDPARVAALRRASAEAVDFLERFEFVDGGWGYYNFDIVARRPEHGSTSFTTASALLALRRAADRGVPVRPALVRRALDLVQTCRKPDWAFAYSWDHRYFPQGGINKTKGSLARTPVCIGALARWGDRVPQAPIVKALEDLHEHGHFLLIARKYPIPHETWYQNSGYFCFYGYRYASELFDLVPRGVARRHAHLIASTLVPLQEADGSWWDYQLYSYHKAYGTGYLLQTLAACRAWL